MTPTEQYVLGTNSGWLFVPAVTALVGAPIGVGGAESMVVCCLAVVAAAVSLAYWQDGVSGSWLHRAAHVSLDSYSGWVSIGVPPRPV